LQYLKNTKNGLHHRHIFFFLKKKCEKKGVASDPHRLFWSGCRPQVYLEGAQLPQNIIRVADYFKSCFESDQLSSLYNYFKGGWIIPNLF
jgi:hypothetical protein